ncbi:hypothetical protein MTO96_004764 [Rhipicephalus appendiculatus]
MQRQLRDGPALFGPYEQSSLNSQLLYDTVATGRNDGVTRETPSPCSEQPVGSELPVEECNEAGRLITAGPPVGQTDDPYSKEFSRTATLVLEPDSPLEPEDRPDASPASERGRTLRCTSVVSAVVCSTVVFTIASIVVAAVIATRIAVRSYTALTMRLQLVHDLSNVCESHGCRQALWLINASCLTYVDICYDFYNFVCGRWDAKTPIGRKASYAKTLRFNYSSMVDEALARTLFSPQAKGTDAYNMALAYSSCVGFWSNTSTNLDNMFQAARVNPRAFIEVKNFSQLFQLMIRTNVETKLMSVVKVVYIMTNATVGVLTGTSMHSASFIPEIEEALLEQLASSLGDRGVFKIIDAMDKLDKLIMNITDPHLEDTALSEALTARADLPAHGVYWEDVLMKYAPAPVGFRRPLRTNSEGAIRGIFHALTSAPLDVTKVYLMIVPFARYVSFELRAASRRSFLPDSMMAGLCVRYLYAMFGPRAHAILMQVMGTDKAASSQMWHTLRQRSQALLKVGAGFKLRKDALQNATLKSHRDNVGPDVGGVLRVAYSSDFMANLIILARHTGKQAELRPFMLPVENEAEVATEQLVPDFYYNDSIEASVNYGTLGGYMARMLFDVAFPERYSSKYVDCLVEYTAHNAIPFDKTDWRRYVNMQWSMNVAFESLQSRLATARSPILHDRLFFLRYAISLCGEDTPVKKSLHYAVSTSTSFAAAFNCYKPPTNPCA